MKKLNNQEMKTIQGGVACGIDGSIEAFVPFYGNCLFVCLFGTMSMTCDSGYNAV